MSQQNESIFINIKIHYYEVNSEDKLVYVNQHIPNLPLWVAGAPITQLELMVVSFASLIPNFLKLEQGIRLILAPRSHNALPKKESPMFKGMVKLSRSFNFGGNLP